MSFNVKHFFDSVNLVLKQRPDVLLIFVLSFIGSCWSAWRVLLTTKSEWLTTISLPISFLIYFAMFYFVSEFVIKPIMPITMSRREKEFLSRYFLSVPSTECIRVNKTGEPCAICRELARRNILRRVAEDPEMYVFSSVRTTRRVFKMIGHKPTPMD